MNVRLVSMDALADITLNGEVTLVGRHSSCEVRLQSSRVSRRHCCLIAAGNQVLVRDLGSTNGTKINNQPIVSGTLVPGDELRIAHYRFRLVTQTDERPEMKIDSNRGRIPDDSSIFGGTFPI
jgi:pSer/pThr/pTyr-binding forkhead associated (FHA) protein